MTTDTAPAAPADEAAQMRAARALLDARPPERARELRAALPGYARYLFGHALGWPYYAYRGARHARKTGEGGDVLRERFWGGVRPPRPTDGWVCVFSTDLGETRAAVSMAEEIAAAGAPVAVLTTIRRSRDLARRTLPSGAPAGLAPYNNPLAVCGFLARWRPRAVLFAGYNSNHHHLTYLAKRMGVPTVVFNSSAADAAWNAGVVGRRPHSAWRYTQIGAYAVHSEEARARLVAVGVDPSRVAVTGPMLSVPRRTDAEREAARRRWAALVAAESGAPVVVAGSTHAPEEGFLLDAFAALRERHPGAVLALAPRVLARDGGPDSVLRARGVPFVRRSQMGEGGARPADVPVLLLDTTGELSDTYSVATIAHVGGTFDAKLGGHTPAEALAWGVPLTLGPEFEQQRSLIEVLEPAGMAAVCQDASGVAAAWLRWAGDPNERDRVRAESARLRERYGGVARRVYEGLIG